MNTVKTPKGTELPLLNLRGKMYLQVAHRIQWFNEVATEFSISTEILRMDKEESIVKATIYDNKQNRSATATKREDSKGFADHLEKAETGAIGRALALLGYGTQFALSDLDEGNRLADSPLTDVKNASEGAMVPNNAKPTAEQAVAKNGSFKKAQASTSTRSNVDGWDD